MSRPANADEVSPELALSPMRPVGCMGYKDNSQKCQYPILGVSVGARNPVAH